MSNIRKQIELEESVVKWYQGTYNDSPVMLSWILNLLLTRFRDAHKLTPAQIADEVAKELHEELEE